MPVTVAPTALIELDALRHNARRAAKLAAGAKLFCVLKANAYGHGLLHSAKALEQLGDALAVARVDEAASLREAGIRSQILVLEGALSPAELAFAADYQLALVVHHGSQLAWLEESRPKAPIEVWIKLDTGMHRLGFDPSAARDAWLRLRGCRAVRPNIGMLSHLANADSRRNDFTQKQLDRFAEFLGTLGRQGWSGQSSLGNSAALLGWRETHAGWLRPGLMLYGASPFPEDEGRDHGLLPVMTFSTHLIAINRVRSGAPVGYGGSWICPEDMDVGVAAAGYGDGYSRHIPSGAPVLLAGREAPLVGRISMDMITIDLRQHAEARVGDPVTLWGDGLPVERIARLADTIPYTLLCGVSSRVRYDYRGPDT